MEFCFSYFNRVRNGAMAVNVNEPWWILSVRNKSGAWQ